jgi:hypothetical protein
MEWVESKEANMNQQLKQGHYAPLPTPGHIQNENNSAHAVTEYEKCQNAVTDRTDASYQDPKNSGMPDQKKG